MTRRERKIPELKPLFVERMEKLFPKKEDLKEYMNILKKLPVRSIRCNKIKISPTNLKKKLEKKGWIINQPWKNYPEVMIIKGKIKSATSTGGNEICCRSEIRGSSKETRWFLLEPGELGRAIEHILGYYYIQELASMLPIIALAPKEGETILDLCSAPGSKTTQMASEMNNTGTIIANELSLGRIKILASNLERCGVTNTIITKKEGSALCKRLKKGNFQFNKILIDAPCSGEGTLRSTPKTYIMWNIKTIKYLPRIQEQLIESALEILKPKGEIIYSTCTHAPEENEGVINQILQKHKGKIKLETISLPVKYRKGITKWEDENYDKSVENGCREIGRAHV